MSEIVDIARLIRFHLPELVDEPELDGWVREIREILRAAHEGEHVDSRLRALFARDLEVQAWGVETLRHPDLLPPGLTDGSVSRSEPLAGDRVGSRLQVYVCPVGQCVKWHRLYPHEVVPRCPDHHVVLVEVPPR